ncbi:MAG: hypothetical protein J6T10_16555 [Methanobrevibacter sp.]|nr:hypothetical protein [Methanobrevibacter sp.]
MKLRNKKTGEICDLSEGFIRDTYSGEMIQIKPFAISNKEGYVYSSLAELNKEWEDYEEPKGCWIINILGIIEYTHFRNRDEAEILREIGNYFETKEEAEKAAEKLKAWQRLKDKGLKVTEWSHGLYLDKTIVGRFRYEFPIDNKEDIEKDLDLLIGGEE